jgi:hypothetical protein
VFLLCERSLRERTSTILSIVSQTTCIPITHTPFSQFSRRDAYNTILQAQAYYNRGKYDFAASYAETGLVVAQTLNSVVNIARVEAIHSQLLQGPYAKSVDVAKLGHQLEAHGTQRTHPQNAI